MRGEGFHEGMHFSYSKNASLLNFLVDYLCARIKIAFLFTAVFGSVTIFNTAKT